MNKQIFLDVVSIGCICYLGATAFYYMINTWDLRKDRVDLKGRLWCASFWLDWARKAAKENNETEFAIARENLCEILDSYKKDYES